MITLGAIGLFLIGFPFALGAPVVLLDGSDGTGTLELLGPEYVIPVPIWTAMFPLAYASVLTGWQVVHSRWIPAGIMLALGWSLLGLGAMVTGGGTGLAVYGLLVALLIFLGRPQPDGIDRSSGRAR